MFTPQVIFKSKFVLANCVNSTSHLKEKLIKIGKYNVNYLKVGSGSHNVLLTPGALGTIWNNYKEQIQGFNLNKFSLVIFDPPGYGKSIPPKRQQDRRSYERDADIGAELMKDYYPNDLKAAVNSNIVFSRRRDEKLIKIGKYNVNYLKVGSGSHNVLLTPGTLGTIWNNYKEQIQGFDLNKFSLVIFDPPGYGKSIPPKRLLDKHSYERDADIGAELMKILNINKYSLLGYSAGGTASLIHAAKYQNAVLNLVVSGAIAFVLPHELDVYRKTKDLRTWADDMKEPMIQEYGEEKLAEYWADWIDGMEIVFKLDQDICSQIVCDIKCPTLIIHGGKDRLVDKTHVKFLKSQIKNSTAYLYPEGRHNIHMQYPEDFNNRVQEFLLHSVPDSSATTVEINTKTLSSKI